MRKLLVLVGVLAVALPSRCPAQQPAAVKAFTGMRLIDGTDRAPIDNATIVVRDGRIVAAGPAGQRHDSGGRRARVAGREDVIPGLINAHGHVEQPRARDLETYAAYGVTTVVQPGRRRNAPALSPRATRRATPSLDPGAHLRRRAGARPEHARGGARRRWPRSRR